MLLKINKKPRFVWALLVVAIAFVAVIACYYILHPERADVEPANDIQASLGGDRSQSRKQELLSKALRQRLLHAGAESSEPTEEEETPINIGQDSKEKMIKQAERTRRTTPYHWELAPVVFEEMLEGQTADPNWTTNAESEAKRFLAREEFEGTEVVDTDCRETLCRMKLEHANEDAYDSFKRRGAPRGPWLKSDAHGKRKSLMGGGVQTSFYFSKEEDPRAFEEMRERLLEKVIAIEEEEQP